MMRVRDIMRHGVRTCGTDASLADAALVMWRSDLGAIPIINNENRPIAMITDRDICMAAMLAGVPLRARGVMTAMSKSIVTCRQDASIAEVEKIMQEAQIRRVPVVNDDGVLVGIITLADIANHAAARPVAAPGVSETLAAIVERRWDGATAAAE